MVFKVFTNRSSWQYLSVSAIIVLQFGKGFSTCDVTNINLFIIFYNQIVKEYF